ncbi:MAG: type I-B CRISPR-associated protein Cas5b [Promethearchaeota archaeon]
MIENIKNEFIPEKILIFDIFGPMAHFRNIQTNTSSLSYTFPPPTTIIGIIAAILGYKRDSYYKDFLPDNIFLSIGILKEIRKIIQTINYRFYEDPGYTQIPVEILIPKKKNEHFLTYRIYFSMNNEKIYNNLKTKLSANSIHYPLYLGISELIAQINYIGEFLITKIKQKINEIKIHSVINIEELNIIEIPSNYSFFIEIMRKNFKKNREPDKLIKIMYTDAKKLKFIQNPKTLYAINSDEGTFYISRII